MQEVQMRAIALVLAVLVGGCGDAGQDEQAPECDIPPMVCEDGSDAMPPANPPKLYESRSCRTPGGEPVATWSVFPNGQVTYNPAAGDTTACWTLDTTVALRRTYVDRATSAESSDECWDRDGEPAECAAVLAEYNKAAMSAE